MGRPARGKALRPHELRDGDVFNELQAALTMLGHVYGGRIINHPVRKGGPDTSMDDMIKLGPDDLLVVSSRPPLSEKPKRKGTRLVRPSFPSTSHFEQQYLFKALGNYLMHCTREEISVHMDQADRILSRYRNREDLSFFLKGHGRKGRFEAAYSVTAGAGRYAPFVEDKTTAAYLIHTGPLEMPGGRKGPRVLAAFGVSGTVSLVFANQLWKQKLEPFRGLLKAALARPSLSIVEITVRGVPDYYTSVDFSDDWSYKLITRPPGE